MDANVDINKNPYLLQMLQHGWVNVAEGYPDYNAPTFATSKDWDRTTKCSGATRIDYALANPAGRQLVSDFTLLRDLSTKQHLGLQVTLNLERMDQEALRYKGPTPYLPTPEGIPDEELQALGDMVATRFQARLAQDDAFDNVEETFCRANQASHDYNIAL